MNSRTLLTLAISIGLVGTACHHADTHTTSTAAAPAGTKNKLHLTDYPTFGNILRLDSRLDAIIPPDTKLEKLAEGFDWAEGPVWIRDGHYLVFSDVPQNRIYSWSEGKPATVFMQPSGYTGSTPRGGEPGSNGLTTDSQGRLVLCEHGDRRISRLELNGKKSTLAQYYKFYRFNSPNDLVYSSKGDLFFTDPPYGLLQKNDDPAKELPYCGVYRLSSKGQLTLLTSELPFPNGIALSPDEKTLYIAVSDPDKPIITAWDLSADGTIANRRTFFDATALYKAGLKGLPDGLKVDKNGNVFATAPGGVLILAPDGTHLGTIETGEATANCNWGNDGSVLYITADMYLCRVRTSTKGKGW